VAAYARAVAISTAAMRMRSKPKHQFASRLATDKPNGRGSAIEGVLPHSQSALNFQRTVIHERSQDIDSAACWQSLPAMRLQTDRRPVLRIVQCFGASLRNRSVDFRNLVLQPRDLFLQGFLHFSALVSADSGAQAMELFLEMELLRHGAHADLLQSKLKLYLKYVLETLCST
jgi:hypothetical protein